MRTDRKITAPILNKHREVVLLSLQSHEDVKNEQARAKTTTENEKNINVCLSVCLPVSLSLSSLSLLLHFISLCLA